MSEPVRTTLASLVTAHPGAPRVLASHGLDFCFEGEATLAAAARAAGLDARALLDEIAEVDQALPSPEPWGERTVGELVDHVVARFHVPLRMELARLVELALEVRTPAGLAAHLQEFQESLDLHMQKEEEVLFPLLRSGRGALALVPTQIMEEEHRDHGRSLRHTRALTGGLAAPPDASDRCRALYLGLEDLECCLMEHIHFENRVLFPRAAADPAP